jgi:hypothetical protein
VIIDFNYKVKMINSCKKSDYSVKKFKHSGKFRTVKELVTILSTTFDINVGKVGYMLPGHGLKGKHHYIHTDNQVSDMYDQFKGKCEILLCCWYLTGNQPVIVEDDTSENENMCQNSLPTIPAIPPKPSKRCESITKKITEAEDIMNTLGMIHHKKYSVQQLSSWAHMIQMGSHHSYDTPPDLPYFTGNRKHGSKKSEQSPVHKKSDEEMALTSSPCKRKCGSIVDDDIPQTFSPSKRLKIRGECVDQLRKWHELLERGGISQEQYEDIQKTIMADMNA